MGFWLNAKTDFLEMVQNRKVKSKRSLNRMRNFCVTFPEKFTLYFKNLGQKIKYSFLNFPNSFLERSIDLKNRILTMPTRTWQSILKMRDWRLKDFSRFFLNNAILLALILLIVIIGCVADDFWRWEIFVAIFKQASPKLFIALGTGIIIVARGTDLSAGRAAGLTALVTSLFSQKMLSTAGSAPHGLNSFTIVLISMLLGIFIGSINGFFIARFNVDPFIATLGMMLVLIGLNMYIPQETNGGAPIGNYDSKYSGLANDGFMLFGSNFPYVIVIAFCTAFLMWILWTKTPFGKKVFAVGGNPKAAAVSGISVGLVLVVTYMIGGMMYGVGGSYLAWTSGSAGPTSGNMYELDAIAACIVGGLSFTGGKGRVSGIILGVLIFQAITFGFDYIGMSSAIISIIKGIIIIVACSFDMVKNKVKK